MEPKLWQKEEVDNETQSQLLRWRPERWRDPESKRVQSDQRQTRTYLTRPSRSFPLFLRPPPPPLLPSEPKGVYSSTPQLAMMSTPSLNSQAQPCMPSRS